MQFSVLLRWYLIFTLIILFNIALLFFGVFTMIWEADMTKLSFVILVLFFFGSIKCGADLYRQERNGVVDPQKLKFGWFLGEILLSLGMVGTVIGFIIIMKDFAFINFSELATIKDLIKSLGAGVSTALYTTLSGLTANILLKVQYFLFEEASGKLDGQV